MNNFKVTKSGKYFHTELIKFEPANFTIQYRWSTSMLHDNREETERYMKFVLDMEKQVENELKEQGLDLEPLKVVVASLKNVESWSGSFAFDIRHDIGIDKQANLIISWYVDGLNKAKLENEILFKKISANGKGGYEHKNWKEDEKYNDNNLLYEFEMESLDEYYGKDRLDRMSDTLDELNKSTRELIDKMNRDREAKNKSREEAVKDLKIGDNILIPSASNKKDEPDIPAVVEKMMEDNIIKARVHSKLLVEVPTRMIKYEKN